MQDASRTGQRLTDWTQVTLLALISLYAFTVLRTAWLCDDVYITLRTVANFVHGHGPNYNIGERVQAYTHPLWMFLLSLNYFLFRETFLTTIALSAAVSVAALVMVFKIATSARAALLAGGVLILSKAYVDYSTSGLENPLTHLLLAVYFAVYFSPMTGRRQIPWLALTTALALINRLDIVLLIAPSFAVKCWEHRRKFPILALAAGFTPFVLWEAFSLIYYGFPLPNTAYAKVFTDFPRFLLFEQGLYYYLNSLNLDPITLFVIAASIVVTVHGRRRAHVPVIIGVMLYLAYILKIGGDFMSGRFLTAPLLVSVVVLARHPFTARAAIALGLILLLLGLGNQRHPLLNVYHFRPHDKQEFADRNGIADERGYYYDEMSLLRLNRNFELHKPIRKPRVGDETVAPPVIMALESIGMFGYSVAAGYHLVDVYALVDPLLARMQARHEPLWRIGHMKRTVPEGYQETLESGENRLTDPKLAEYYDKLRIVTRGELFSIERLGLIVRLNLGSFDHLIDKGRYRDPFTYDLAIDPARTPIDSESEERGGLFHAISPKGALSLTFVGGVWPATVELTLDSRNRYQVSYFIKDEEIARETVDPPGDEPMIVHAFDLPKRAWARGLDRIRIAPLEETKPAVLRDVRIRRPDLLLIEPNGYKPIVAGSKPAIRWQINREIGGKSVRFEVWRAGERVSEIGTAWDDGSHVGPVTSWITLPELEPGDDYQLRVVSAWDDAYYDECDGPLTIVDDASDLTSSSLG